MGLTNWAGRAWRARACAQAVQIGVRNAFIEILKGIECAFVLGCVLRLFSLPPGLIRLFCSLNLITMASLMMRPAFLRAMPAVALRKPVSWELCG
jgi:hypothetical protein